MVETRGGVEPLTHVVHLTRTILIVIKDQKVVSSMKIRLCVTGKSMINVR